MASFLSFVVALSGLLCPKRDTCYWSFSCNTFIVGIKDITFWMLGRRRGATLQGLTQSTLSHNEEAFIEVIPKRIEWLSWRSIFLSQSLKPLWSIFYLSIKLFTNNLNSICTLKKQPLVYFCICILIYLRFRIACYKF